MAYWYSENALENLMKSKGAEIYWNNWSKLQNWYHSYMIPEMMKSQIQMDKKYNKRGGSKKRRKRRCYSMPKQEVVPPEDDEDPIAESSSESISPEFLEFYKETLRHRNCLKQERETEQAEEEFEYRLDDEGPEERPTPSTAPPSVQAGSERTEELRKLYGSKALTIQTQETWLQATFDVNQIRYQPKLWPVIPLNL